MSTLALPRLRTFAHPITFAGAAALIALAYNLFAVLLPLPDLRIATAQALTLGAAATAAAFLAARPATRRLTLQTLACVGIVFLGAEVWQAGKSGTPLAQLALDLLVAVGLLSLNYPLLRAPTPARA